jgi:Hypothetical glycosyl hydrolase family 15
VTFADEREVMSRRITATATAAIGAVILATAAVSGASGQQPPRNATPPAISGTSRSPNALPASSGHRHRRRHPRRRAARIAGEGTLRLGTSPQHITNGNKFAMLGNGGFYSVFSALPGRKIKYASGAQVWDNSDISPRKATARANGWLLHNSRGKEIPYTSGGNGLLVNPGNVGFQNDLKQRILKFLARHPFESGVYFDNFMMDMRDFPNVNYPIYNQSNQLLFSNPTDYQNAEISFIRNVGAALKARGYYVGVNARGSIPGDNASDTGALSKEWIDRYYPYVSATMIEYWQQRSGDHTVVLSGDDTFYHHWDGWESVMAYAQSKGLGFIPLCYVSSTELAQTRYLRGSYLLQWNGSSRGAILLAGWTSADIWNSAMAFNPGQPTGARYQVATGVWRRNFAHGYVIVNPTRAAVTVRGVSIASGAAILHQNRRRHR